MVAMNNPVTDSNGEQALWIDGRLLRKDGQVISHLGKGFPKGTWVWDSFIADTSGTPFEGFRWRTDSALNINYIWPQVYITDAPSGRSSLVWFDDLVVATRYIGPLQSSDNVGVQTPRSIGGIGLDNNRDSRTAIFACQLRPGHDDKAMYSISGKILSSRKGSGIYLVRFRQFGKVVARDSFGRQQISDNFQRN
jgi:hypothetical protein